MRSDSIGKIAGALAKAQQELGSAKKDKNNPFFQSRYASITAVLDIARDPLSKNEIAVSQYPIEKNAKFYLETILMHSSGEYLTCEMPLLMQKHDMQGLGSAMTYAKRYVLESMLCIPEDDDKEDDDGNAACKEDGGGDGNAASTGAKHKNYTPPIPKPVAPPKAIPVWKFDDKHMDVIKSLADKAGMAGAEVMKIAGKKLEFLTQEEYAALIGAIQKRIMMS